MQVLHTIYSASRLLGITAEDIQSLVDSGQIETSRVAGKLRISEHSLNRYLLSRIAV